MRVTDDDGGTTERTVFAFVAAPPALTLELDRSSVDEDDGAAAAMLTVRRSGGETGSNQTIRLFVE